MTNLIFDVDVHTSNGVFPLLCDEASGYEANLKAEDDMTITELRVSRKGELVYLARCHRLIQAGQSMTVNLAELAILYSNPERLKFM